MVECNICNKEVSRLAKHVASAHPSEFKRQEELILAYYAEGLSARKIADKEDIMYTGGTSVVRVLKRFFSADELEAGRRQRIGVATAKAYAAGERDWVSDINSERAQSESGRRKNSEGLRRAYADGRKESWNVGKTKETDERIQASAIKTSATMKDKVGKGEISTLFLSGPDSQWWKGGVHELNSTIRDGKVFSAGDRNLIMRNSEFKCQLCGKHKDILNLEKECLEMNRWGLECDHVIPIFKGGERDPVANGQALCTECHLVKSVLENGKSVHKTVDNNISLNHKLLAKLVNGDFKGHSVACGEQNIYLLSLQKQYERTHANDLRAEGNLFFYQDEWVEKRDIVLSVIANKVTGTSLRIGARKCDVRTVPTAEAKVFMDASHLSGYTASTAAWGLFYKDELVSLITVRKPFIKKHRGSLEIARFATKKGYVVVGGMSRLMSHVKKWAREKGFDSILSYADLKIGSGQAYSRVGFELVGKTNLDYFYTDGFKRFNRFKFRAQDGMTEKEYAASKGVHRIYGCGSNIFKMDLG